MKNHDFPYFPPTIHMVLAARLNAFICFDMRPHSLTFLQKPNIINVLYNTLNSSTEYVSYLLEETIALFTIFFLVL
jgi:hypothetical protein